MKTELLYKLPAADLVALLNEINATGAWQTSGDKEIKGCCPFHGENTPSFYIVLDKGFCYCFGCGKQVSDLNKLVAMMCGIPYAQSFRRNFVERFNLKIPRKEQELLAEGSYRNDTMLAFASACTQVLNLAYQNPDEQAFSYVQPAIEFLQDRNVPAEEWDTLEIGAFPTRRHLFDYMPADMRGEIDKVLFAYMEQNPDHAGRYGGHLTFAYRSSPDIITGIKVREPTRGGTFLYVKVDEDHTGFWGLHLLETFRDARKRSMVVVEGEFDAIAALVHQKNHSAAVDTMFVGGGGGAIDDCTMLAECDASHLVLLGDNDSAGMNFTLRGMTEADHSKFKSVRAYDWPAAFADYKDVDELVQAGKGDEFFATLSTCTTPPHIWAKNIVNARLRGIPAENIAARVEVVKRYAAAVPDRLSKESFLDAAGKTLGVSTAHLLRDLATPDTEDGYKELLRLELEKLMVPLAREGTTKILCYSHMRREMFDLVLDRPRDVKITIQNLVLLEELYTWCSRVLGIPEWIEVKGQTKAGPRLRTEEEKAKLMEQVLDRAIQELVAAAPALGAMHSRSSGVHYADATLTADDLARLPVESAPQRLYVVNGHDVFVGHIDKESTDIKFEQLTVPIHGNYLFSTFRPRWSSNINELSDLSTPCTTNAVAMFEDLKRVISEAWSFECSPGNEDLQPTFLAAYLFTVAIASAFPQVMMIFFNAPSHSGKSTLMNGILRGSMYPQIHLCEHVIGFDDYSTAGITQTTAGSSLCVTLDEFEAPDNNMGSKKKQVVQGFLEMTRNMGAGVAQVRGTMGHAVGRSSFFRFPCVVAGVHPLKDDVDLNRWNTIRLLHRGGGWTPPEIRVMADLGADKIKEYKRALTLIPIQNVSAIMRQHAILETLVLNDREIVYKQSRFMKNLLPVLSVLKWLQQDWKDFGTRYVTQYESMVETSTVSLPEHLFATIFNAKNVKVPGEAGNVFTATQLLGDPARRERINDSACGVYWDQATPNYVVVHMPTVAMNLLTATNSSFSGGTNPMTLLEHLKGHPLASYNPLKFARLPSLMRMMSGMVTGFKPAQAVLFELDKILPPTDVAQPSNDSAPSDDAM